MRNRPVPDGPSDGEITQFFELDRDYHTSYLGW